MADIVMPSIPGLSGPTSPAVAAAAITPHDTNAITVAGQSGCRAVWVGTGGNINCVPIGQTAAVVFPSVPGGAFWQMSCMKILATSTTASGLVGVL